MTEKEEQKYVQDALDSIRNCRQGATQLDATGGQNRMAFAIKCIENFFKLVKVRETCKLFTTDQVLSSVADAEACLEIISRQHQSTAKPPQSPLLPPASPGLKVSEQHQQSAAVSSPKRNSYVGNSSQSAVSTALASARSEVPDFATLKRREAVRRHYERLIAQAVSPKQASELRLQMHRELYEIKFDARQRAQQLDKTLKKIQQSYIDLHSSVGQGKQPEAGTRTPSRSFMRKLTKEKPALAGAPPTTANIIAEFDRACAAALNTQLVKKQRNQVTSQDFHDHIVTVLHYQQHPLADVAIKCKEQLYIRLRDISNFTEKGELMRNTMNDVMDRIVEAYPIEEFIPTKSTEEEVEAFEREADMAVEQYFFEDGNVTGHMLHHYYNKQPENKQAENAIQQMVSLWAPLRIQESDIPTDLQLEGSETPYISAISLLSTVNESPLPSKRGQIIKNSIRALAKEVEQYSSKKGKVKLLASDDIVSILPFVICKAKPLHLLFTVELLSVVFNKNRLLGEDGFVLATAQLSASILAGLADEGRTGDDSTTGFGE